MNRSVYQTKENSLRSRTFFNNLRRAFALSLLALVSAVAVAQYGGGTGGTASYPSYGSKGAVIGAVAGGAAAAGLLYWKFHSHSKLQGCVAGDGNTLVTEKDNYTYKLTNKQNQSLRTGQRVELLGKKAKDSSGEPTFEVRKLNKELGQCTTTEAAALKSTN